MPLVLKPNKFFTYSDYLEWHDDERWEIIAGIAYNMTPAPLYRHQLVVGNFYNILKNNLKGNPCVPVIAPTDVVFSEYDVVQPDILVVCDKKKITEANIQGAPDLIIEILSPSTVSKDKREKKFLYEKYKVKEYIIVDIVGNFVKRFYLKENGKYGESEIFTSEETMKLFSLNDMKIALLEVFENL